MRSPEDRLAALGGIGLLKPAPGTWGSAAVLPFAWAGPGVCLALSVVFLLVGLWALRARRDDPAWVVVDEGAGQTLALAALPMLDGWALLPWVLAGFALFRALDILKPGPIGWIDRRAGPWGIMGDDMLAGLFAGLVLILARGVLS